MFDLNSLVRENIKSLEPYRCARDDFKEGLLLDANENTHGTAIPVTSKREDDLQLNRYPDPHQIELKQQICDFRNAETKSQSKHLVPANLCLGVGSDESIDLLMRCVCKPSQDDLLICPPTYGMYSICAKVNDVQILTVPLTPAFEVDVEAVYSKLHETPSIKLLYLTSPGNPTGKLLSHENIVHLLKLNWNGLVVVDEAYIDFSPPGSSFAPLVNEYPNLVVLQTLSKSFGLAGIRLGVTFASEELSSYLNAMKYPYNISSLTSDIALRATSVAGLEKMTSFVSEIIFQRAWLLKELQSIKGVGKNIGGLDSNFLLLEIVNDKGEPCNEIAKEVYSTLAVEKAVVVRFRGSELNCRGCLRITVGTKDENVLLVKKFKEVLEVVEN